MQMGFAISKLVFGVTASVKLRWCCVWEKTVALSACQRHESLRATPRAQIMIDVLPTVILEILVSQ